MDRQWTGSERVKEGAVGRVKKEARTAGLHGDRPYVEGVARASGVGLNRRPANQPRPPAQL